MVAAMSTRYFVIGQDGRSHGPLSPEEVGFWLREGFVNRYSRARPESDGEWRPLQAFEELREIVTPPARTEATTEAEGGTDTAGRGRVNITSSFSRAWALISRHFIELAGWSLSTGLLLFLISRVPRVGWFLGLMGNSVVTGMLSVIYLARIRGRRADMRDVIAAISATAVNICLIGFTQALLTSVGAVLLVTTGLYLALGVVLLMAPALYLAVSYVFAITLTIDKRLHFWAALETSRRVITRQWWTTFGLLVISVALVAGGVLTYGIGLVLAVPLSTAALMYAYEDVFGE
jgi:hypothetical protein